MRVGAGRGDAAARGALQVALLDEVGFDDVFQGAAFFANAGSQGIEADRPAAEVFDDDVEQAAVEVVKAAVVDGEQFERFIGDGAGDDAAAAYVGVVAHAAQEAVGDARRAARAFADFDCAVAFHLHAEQFARAQDDGGQLAFAVEL